MAELINANVFDGTKKFVDLEGLDYFWEKARAYVDGLNTAMDARVDALEKIDHNAYVTADETVLATAKSYADGLVMADGVAKFDAKGAAAQALVDAKADAAEKYQPKGNYEAAGAAATAKSEAIAQAKLDAAEALKAYYKKTETYSKTEVGDLLSTNSEADKAYAKQYTDELFNSFKFAANSDIDALFAVKVN